MPQIYKWTKIKKTIAIIICSISLFCVGIWQAFGHGGKSHGDVEFTSLEAVQKATGLYDRLITSGKLTAQWETGLVSITVGIRKLNGKREYMVEFKRTEGDPAIVYFFFDLKGAYSGSNFTGK